MRKRGWRACVAAIALFAAFGTGAAPIYWKLDGARFDDGAAATGSFAFDSASGEISAWNVRVGIGEDFLPFTYLPGDSIAYVSTGWAADPAAVTLNFRSVEGGISVGTRDLRITPLAPLDGALATVGIDIETSLGGGGVECFNCHPSRQVVAGTLTRLLLPPPVALVPIVEFHHAGFDHYFVSADPVEIDALDTGHFAGWARTGYTFRAYASGSNTGGTIHPVCRYYGLPSAGIDSHFYSASTRECREVDEFYGTEWQIESDNVFQIDLPDTTTGACPGGTIPVYRLFNGRRDANHRYTTSAAVRAQMEALGWIREGYGPDATIMCALP